QPVEARGQHLDALDLDGRAGQIIAGGTGGLGLELLQFLLQLAVAFQQAGQLVQQVLAAALDQLGRFLELLLGSVQVGQGQFAGDRLDAADAGGNAPLADDLEQADVAGTRHVGATAQLDGEDRKSTRLNSSHVKISYAVFCLNKKT